MRGAGISPEFYANLGIGLDTSHGVAYAGVREMVDKYSINARRSLDYGCGAGRSTRFLKQIGLEEVIGVDVSQEMLNQAKQRAIPGTSYMRIKSGCLPFGDNTFDLVFSGLVIPEISSADEVHNVLSELQRVVAEQGTIIILGCNKDGYLTASDEFEPVLTPRQQANIKDGDPVPTRVKATGQEFTDYYWSEEFMKSELQEVGLTVVEVKLPSLSQSNEEPRYVVYVCKKP